MRKLIVLLLLLLPIFAFSQRRDSVQKFGYHFQQTLVGQVAINGQQLGDLPIQDSGHNSFKDNQLKISLSATFYLGFKLWHNGSFYIDPDIAGGSGIGGTLGMAGYANGEIFRVGNPAPSFYVSRVFIRQYIPLSSSKSFVQPDNNQLGEWVPDSRLQITVGKFTLGDMFDNNHYSHDPRTRFLNWSLMNAGAFDFASNTKGYTWGVVTEYITPFISARAGIGLEPQYSNGPLTTNRRWNGDNNPNSNMLDLETGIYNQGYGLNFELEKPFKLQSGKNMVIRLLGFVNHVQAANYTAATKLLHTSDSAMYSSIFIDNGSLALDTLRPHAPTAIKYGFSLNIEKPIGAHAGAFTRLSWNDGQTESYAFAEIDRSESIGCVLHGEMYHRYHDRIEFAFVSNQLSTSHKNYLEAGGYGFMLGEPNLKYAPENIIELQYIYDLGKDFTVSPDYQLIMNPGYDSHRGPISVIGLRTHVNF